MSLPDHDRHGVVVCRRVEVKAAMTGEPGVDEGLAGSWVRFTCMPKWMMHSVMNLRRR